MGKESVGKLSREEKELLARKLLGTVDLLDAKEMRNFRLGINYEEDVCQDLVLKQRGKSFEECKELLEAEGVPVVGRYFNYRKKKELLDIMDKISVRYAEKEPEKAEAANTAITLLNDKMFNPGYLPLLEAILMVELKEMEDEIFCDPQYFEQRGKRYLESGDFEQAKRFFILERGVDESHWSSYESMAAIYYKQGMKEDAVREINEALSRVYTCWKEEQQYLDYEVVEELEEKADEILGRDRAEFLKRLSKYAYGILYFLGAASLETIAEEIQDLSVCKSAFTRDELRNYLSGDPRVAADGSLFFLKELPEPRGILGEVARRGLKQSTPCSLSGLKLAEEGRISEMFFTQNSDYKDLDKELRNLSKGTLGLAAAYEQIRQDVTGRRHFDGLINRLVQERNVNIARIVEILNVIWNEFPRWELGGRVPSEIAKKAREAGQAPDLHAYMTSFQPPGQDTPVSKQEKPGRNDPCLCGSGKKYKKCCGR